MSINTITKAAIKISYSELQNPTAETLSKIKSAFGYPESLGIILIDEIPQFVEFRERLLKLGPILASLPVDELESLEDEESRYMFGWSHGKEFMNGKYDFVKGSFYANPQFDVPTTDKTLVKLYPEYCHPNLWPASLPALKPAFQNLGRLMVDIGILVGRMCDLFLRENGVPEWGTVLEEMIRNSRSNKGRFLHYFPSDDHQAQKELDSWCGWHLDHSCLTALTSPMYLDGNDPSKQVEPSSDAGLYIKSKSDHIIKVDIPYHCMAFQTGEALELLTRGKLKATPHCVKSSRGNVSRETLALFLQPDWTQEVKEGYKFTEFTKTVLTGHYGAYDNTETEE